MAVLVVWEGDGTSGWSDRQLGEEQGCGFDSYLFSPFLLGITKTMKHNRKKSNNILFMKIIYAGFIHTRDRSN